MIIGSKKNKKPIGLVLWEGPSLIDGQPIVVIATGVFGDSENRKTGNVIQTYILKKDMPPHFARRLGTDTSICGDCKHKEANTCYVNLCHGPIPVFNAYLNNGYREYVDGVDSVFFKDKIVRFGSYGDPAAVPYEVWKILSNISRGFMGYTHQWKTCDQRLKNLCMASVDSIRKENKEFELARKMGWRTFRVYGTVDGEKVQDVIADSEIVCPASKEGGVLVSCEKCRICSGLSKPSAKNVLIMFHGDSPATGSNWKQRAFVKVMRAIRDKKAWRVKKYVMNIFKKACPY